MLSPNRVMLGQTNNGQHLSSIAEFNCTIEYTPGKMNLVANALSRVEINSVYLGINYEEIATAQENDPETAAYRTDITSLRWEDVAFGDRGHTILCDVSTGCLRLLIPEPQHSKIFNVVHGLPHLSGYSTAHLIKEKFIWHGMNKDIRQWAQCCITCQTSKVGCHTELGIGDFHQPKCHFGHSCQHGWPPSTIRCLTVPLHHYRVFHTLAKSNTHDKCYRTRLR
ncbi:uncharacterized protein LOC135096773 isoform X1 [Scylla paramamosain]|uniref:uncharacterized protein LOC135096773 isoform X1 n=1 Tax=Scylla paramamosain TaxID=85552 RepID=UPI0030838481